MEIPIGMIAQERGKSWQGTASETSGMVQFSFGGSPFESMGLQWDMVGDAPDLPTALRDYIESLEDLGAGINTRGQPELTAIGDHELLYQPIEASVNDTSYAGIIGAWYCEQPGRVFTLYFAAVSELEQWIDPLTEIERTVGSFACH